MLQKLLLVTLLLLTVAITISPVPNGTRPAGAAFPGGNGKIAFQACCPVSIYVMNPDGSGMTWLTAGEEASWSPDGSKLTFADFVGDYLDIWVVNADGSGRTNITSNPAWDSAPNWSPDGSKIVFESSRDGNEEIYVMNAGGTGVTRLTADPASDMRPAWSPNGSKILFHRGNGGDLDVYLMDADGTDQTNLTTTPGVQDSDADWSPDGSKIVFMSNRDAGNYDIYIMNADGSNVTRLTDDPGFDGFPAWSPDGSKIAYTAHNQHITVMNSDGTGKTDIGGVEVPDWQPVPHSPAVGGVAELPDVTRSTNSRVPANTVFAGAGAAAAGAIAMATAAWYARRRRLS